MADIPKAKIAEIPISLFSSINEAVETIIISSHKVICGNAIAINPEKIVAAKKDPLLHAKLKHATINYCDGIGVVKLLEHRTKSKLSRIPGCELWEAIMKKAGEHHIPVFLLGATESVIVQTQTQLRDQFNVNIAGIQDGFFSDEDAVIDAIVKSDAKIVSVAMGSPKQELFIEKCLARHPNCFYMGVGGTYNVYTGNVKRAPEIYRTLNLEWFYRLIKEPTRIIRHVKLLQYVLLAIRNKI